MAVPAHGDDGLSLRFRAGLTRRGVRAQRDRPVRQQRLAADDHGVAVDGALHTLTLDVRKALRRRQCSGGFRRRGGNGLRDRVLRSVFQCACQPQQFVLVHAVLSDHLDERHLAGGHRPGLVQDDGVDLAGGLQHLRPLDQHAHLRAAAGADQQRGRGRQAQRARAGDHEDRDRRGECRRDGEAGAEPSAEGDDRDRDDDRHEHPGDAVGEALDLGLAGLRVLNESRHLRQLGIGAHTRGAHHQPAARVHCRSGDRVTGGDFDGHRFAGEHRGVDG